MLAFGIENGIENLPGVLNVSQVEGTFITCSWCQALARSVRSGAHVANAVRCRRPGSCLTLPLPLPSLPPAPLLPPLRCTHPSLLPLSTGATLPMPLHLSHAAFDINISKNKSRPHESQLSADERSVEVS